MPRTVTSLLLGALVMGGGAAVHRWVVASAPEPATQPLRDVAPVPVTTAVVASGDAEVVVRAWGTLKPVRTARIAPEVAGRLARVHAGWRDGAPVAAGEELFAVDTRELEHEVALGEARLAQARAALAQARLGVDQAAAAHLLAVERRDALAREEARVARLYDEGHGRESEVDLTRAARVQAEIEAQELAARGQRAEEQVREAAARERELLETLALARTRLSKAAVAAPFDGRILGRPPAVGGWVAAGEPLVELHDVSTLQLRVAVPTEDAVGLRVGSPARVSVPARPDLALQGAVGAVGALADERTRTVPVEVDVPNAAAGSNGDAPPREPLLGGQFAEAEIDAGVLEGVIVVDRGHFTYVSGVPVAYVVATGEAGRAVAAARRLELGRPLGEGRLVRAGLEEGDVLVTAPLRQLSDGARIAVRAAGER